MKVVSIDGKDPFDYIYTKCLPKFGALFNIYDDWQISAILSVDMKLQKLESGKPSQPVYSGVVKIKWSDVGASKLISKLDKIRGPELVIDLRDNGGGNGEIVRHLIVYLFGNKRLSRTFYNNPLYACAAKRDKDYTEPKNGLYCWKAEPLQEYNYPGRPDISKITIQEAPVLCLWVT
jgi:hypothetical protein